MTAKQVSEQIALTVENIGGIETTEVRFSPGVTVLSGRNATNRTSLLRAIMAALGSEDASLKGDADEGSVELTIDGTTYSRRLRRNNGSVVMDGEPYLDDPTLADLFAFLLESNEARRAVELGSDLRDLIMRPVDTAAINAEIAELEREKAELDDELEALETLKRDLPSLEEDRTRLEEEIEETRERLEAKEAELESADADVDETQSEKAELESKLGELRDTRKRLENVRYDIETEQDSIESLRAERSDLEDELADLPDETGDRVEEIQPEIDRLRRRKQQLNSEIGDLQSTIQFNEDVLEDGTGLPVPEGDDGDGAVTDRLVEGDTITCWTCGSAVERASIQSTLDQLRELRREKLDEVSDLESRLGDLTDERSQLERQAERREEITRRVERIDDEIDRRTGKLDELREKREDLTDEVADLETEIEELEEADFGEVLDLHREANQLEFELDQLERDLDEVNEEIRAIEERLDEEDAIRDRRDGVREELEECRTRIDRIETQAVEAFNEHMDAVLDVLEYANLERIWIERSETASRGAGQDATFDLHVVRKTDAGATYEDDVEHLSESEREITGLVFALAGYLVHEVHETVPFMLLDSLEAVDSGRIATLVEYLEGYADSLVVALLSEDAAALDDSYERITDI